MNNDFTACPSVISVTQWVTDVTEQGYEARIPAWCGARTIQEHKDMLLCWGLVRYVERQQDKPERTCVGCAMYAGSHGLAARENDRTQAAPVQEGDAARVQVRDVR